MLPPKDQPSAPKKAKNTARRCQSSRPERRAAARLARAPGSIAPYSWPKLPRMPQPMERERATQRMGRGRAASVIGEGGIVRGLGALERGRLNWLNGLNGLNEVGQAPLEPRCSLRSSWVMAWLVLPVVWRAFFRRWRPFAVPRWERS